MLCIYIIIKEVQIDLLTVKLYLKKDISILFWILFFAVSLPINFSYEKTFSDFQERLDGYKFPVYSTDFCPRNETEWKTRSNVLNCTEKNGYTCLPNEHFTELLEFCYTDPHILIEKGKISQCYYPIFIKNYFSTGVYLYTTKIVLSNLNVVSSISIYKHC